MTARLPRPYLEMSQEEVNVYLEQALIEEFGAVGAFGVAAGRILQAFMANPEAFSEPTPPYTTPPTPSKEKS